jgi:hypothetical protein
METILSIDGIAFPVGSARGISETIEPIQAGELRRTVNGTLVDLTRSEFRKYAVRLSCDDQGFPALDGIWTGQQVTISCASEMRQRAATTEITLGRDAVAGSVRAENPTTGAPITVSDVTGRVVTLASAPAIVSYRPALVCRVVSWSGDFAEWDAENGWYISLEEI